MFMTELEFVDRTFQIPVSQMFELCHFAFAYIRNSTIYSSSWEEHPSHLADVQHGLVQGRGLGFFVKMFKNILNAHSNVKMLQRNLRATKLQGLGH